MKRKDMAFEDGIFWSLQLLVLDSNERQAAEFLLKESGLTLARVLALSKKTGYRVREMNKFLRSCFAARAAK